MKFIELHDETDTFWVRADAIEMIDTEIQRENPLERLSWITLRNDCSSRYCKEPPEEILQKIAEAEQRELEMISEEKRRRERSFMDDWKNEVDEQLGRLTVRKDGDSTQMRLIDADRLLQDFSVFDKRDLVLFKDLVSAVPTIEAVPAEVVISAVQKALNAAQTDKVKNANWFTERYLLPVLKKEINEFKNEFKGE